MAFAPVNCKCGNTEYLLDQFSGKAQSRNVSRPVVSLHHNKSAFRCPAAHSITSKNLKSSRKSLTICAAATLTEMTSVSGQMAKLKEQKKVAFIPFLVAGDPDLATTAEAIRRLDAVGADVIELGIPYSDPLADGPVIQAAGTRALASHTTINKVLDMLKEVLPSIKAPVVVFVYFNQLLRRGMDEFCAQAKAAGAAGILVPDIPLEETPLVREAAGRAGVELVLLCTPTTPAERMERIAKVSQGFVYLVSVTGVTGQRTSNSSRVEGLIELLHSVTDKPVAVGFGVSGPEQARQLVEWGVEGVIVGSALVKALGDAPTPKEGLERMTALAQSIRDAV